MGEIVFSALGEALGSRVAPAAYQALGSQIGRAAGSYIGRAVDQRLFGTTQRYEGARLTDLHLQGSSEGASIPALYGRVRIAGQVIWAARFKENTETTSVGGGKGGGARAKVTDYTYSLSFAVGLCEGEIAQIGRVWANGEPLDLSQFAWRLHRGREDQAVDPLIETIEGAEAAPAYRGLAYIVFEDLPLADFGNVIPQLSFEVMRPAPVADGATRLEERIRGVCLIPGSGEFVYASEAVRRVAREGVEIAENVHVEQDRANLLVALDQLQSALPNCDSVMLVVAWFGDDLRCASCEIRPGVEIASKDTAPQIWHAGGVTRSDARIVSNVGDAPAFGGTPSDESVIQAITELKARGFKVGYYPFILMDVPVGNGLPDPYGGAEQAAFPWRGRIGVSPAPGLLGTPDKSAAAGVDVAAFFGAASSADFNTANGFVTYSGPTEWSYRRFVLHNAHLAQAAGGVDVFLIGSEMRALTTIRDGAASFPAVSALRTLASDVRAILGGSTKITYSADWSEYFGHQPSDGTGDVFFHLDPLWADANIDVVAIDWYPPLTDWRDGQAHLDAALADNIYDADYLKSRIEAGEDFDWYYVSEADRGTQTRSAVADGAYGEPWIYRAKDVRNFWARAHYNRPGGVRDVTPTAWVPESKPVWFAELGVPAVDKGTNSPNLFLDDKSSESAAPPFSNGLRDDLIQRRALEAYYDKWDVAGGENPTSSIYGGAMIDPAGVFVWCWDSRPFPAYPARGDVWTDGDSWRRGHWLSGRTDAALLGDVVRDICERSGVEDVDVSGLIGVVSGYVVDHPSSGRAALEPLMGAYDFNCAERDGVLVFFHPNDDALVTLSSDALTAEAGAALYAVRGDGAETPVEARVRYLDAGRDYQVGSVSARRLDSAEGGVESVDAPLVLEPEVAEALARRVLTERRAASESLSLAFGLAQLALEPGDRVSLDGGAAFEIRQISDVGAREIVLQRAADFGGVQVVAAEPNAPGSPASAPSPLLLVLDLPPSPAEEEDDRPLAAVFASPWGGAHQIYAGASEDGLTRRGEAASPAIVGELVWDLYGGPADRWDEGNVTRVRLYGGTLSSVTREQVLGGGNAFAVEQASGEWEVLQAAEAVLVAPGEYELRDFLRGQQGSEHAIGAPALAGARVVKLDTRLARLDMQAHEWGETLLFAAPPQGKLASNPRTTQLSTSLPHAAKRPWAPAHVRATRDGAGDVTISWVRRARIGGDQWGAGEPPIPASGERYVLEILDGASIVRSVETTSPSFVYELGAQGVDFGSPPANLTVRVAELGEGGASGLKTELTITL